MKKLMGYALLTLCLAAFSDLNAQDRKNKNSSSKYKKETREETVKRWRAADQSVKRQVQRDKENQRKHPYKGVSSSSSSSGKSSKGSRGPVQVRRE